MWRDFPQRLAEATGYGVVAYSRAGYGSSDPVELPRPVTFMHHEALVVLPEVLKALNIRESILFGHSDGGSIALIHAGQFPGPLKLVLEAPHVSVEDFGLRSIERAAQDYEKGTLKTKLERYHANVDCAFWGWNRVWLSEEFRSWNIEEYLPNIRIPVLVIQGVDDQYGTWKQVEAIEKRCAGPVECIALESCGHAPHREQPEQTIALVTRFISQ